MTQTTNNVSNEYSPTWEANSSSVSQKTPPALELENSSPGSPETALLTYLLTPWSRVLFEKLTGSAASQEIPCISGTRKFRTVLTTALHLSLSRANSIQSPQPPPTSWRSILILSSHLRLHQKQPHAPKPGRNESNPYTNIYPLNTHRHTHTHTRAHARSTRLH